MSKIRFVLPFLLLVVAAARAEDRTVHSTVGGDPLQVVSIEVISGKVEVVGWDGDKVDVTGTVGDDVEKVFAGYSRGAILIKVEVADDEDRRLHDVDANLTIKVPRDVPLEVESVSADVSIADVEADVSIETVSGGVSVEGAIGEADIESVSGKIELKSTAALAGGDFETVSGNIEVDADLDSGGDFSFESVSGDIELRLPRQTSAVFEIETFSGHIDNELGPEEAEPASEHGPGQTLQFAVGGGGARVEIEAFSGRVELRAR